jgi:2-polyprenyl-6-methoxyphenol hydroxylase-like FAD-dependent oxidoreductase
MKPPSFVPEPARQTPVAHECDVCVIGGSCTGVFAAVRAARLGASVCLVEHNVILGGMATAAMVNEWHCTFDVTGRERVIGGLTLEMIDRLKLRNAVTETPPPARVQYRFNSAEMAGELDRMVSEHRIRAFLSAKFVATVGGDGTIDAAIIEDKSGRRAIRAKVFIDASGDGDLMRRSGFDAYQSDRLQPATMVALYAGLRDLPQVWERVKHRAAAYDYPLDNGRPWIHGWPGTTDVSNVYGPRLHGFDASDADALSATLIHARRLHRALADMIREEFGTAVSIVGWAHALGVRETWHARCLHQLSSKELMIGERFPDAIANGTYPIDIHHPGGTVLQYLDGREEVIARDGSVERRRWRPESEPVPPCYHVPYRSLVPCGSKNVLVAGRVLDADREAFGGVRVMVNMNQTGEAAGVAAWLAIDGGTPVGEIATTSLRAKLAAGGSIII